MYWVQPKTITSLITTDSTCRCYPLHHRFMWIISEIRIVVWLIQLFRFNFYLIIFEPLNIFVHSLFSGLSSIPLYLLFNHISVNLPYDLLQTIKYDEIEVFGLVSYPHLLLISIVDIATPRFGQLILRPACVGLRQLSSENTNLQNSGLNTIRRDQHHSVWIRKYSISKLVWDENLLCCSNYHITVPQKDQRFTY